MPRGRITFDALIVELAVARSLSAPATARLRRALRQKTFLPNLRRVMRDWLRQSPAFTDVTVTLSR